MERSGLNVNILRERNLSSVLYLLNRKENLSRKDVADELRLTPAAVTKLCSRLIERGLIGEQGEEQQPEARAGRKKIILTLRLCDFYTVGINIEVDKITASVIRLDKTLICSKNADIKSSAEKIAEICRELICESGAEKEKFVCTALCVTGLPNTDDYNVVNTDELKNELENTLSLPVEVDNNIRAFALAEQIYGKREMKKTVLYLKWGPGIGACVTENGEIVTGNDSGIAEIGHYIVRRDGKKCRCGRYGCLETEVSSMAIASDAGGRLGFDEIIMSDDSGIINMLDTKTDAVALALANTSTILNAEEIILFGSVFNNRQIAKKLARQCKRYSPTMCRDAITLSKLNDSLSYIGPAALAAKKHFFEEPLKINGKEQLSVNTGI